MHSVDVIYLARGKNSGLENAERFLDSYEKHAAGYDHNLIIACKAWENIDKEYNILVKRAQKLNAKILNLPDENYDIGAYYRSAIQLHSNFIFCCNSTSEILCDNWLFLFAKHIEQNNMLRFIGASGSWQCTPTLLTAFWADKETAAKDEITSYLNIYKKLSQNENLYTTHFPNYHIRTTGFLIDRKLFLQYIKNKIQDLICKFIAFQIESGPESLTKYILSRGYTIGVAGKNGTFYEKEHWHQSQTFRVVNETNLIIADKQNREYKKLNFFDKFLNNYKVYRGFYSDDSNEKIKIFNTISTSDMHLSSNIYTPICTASSPINNSHYNMYRDDVGDHISYRHTLFGELTIHYWTWKNYIPQHSEKKYIGFTDSKHLLVFNQRLNMQYIGKSYIDVSPKNFYMTFTKQVFNQNTFNCVYDYDICLIKPHCFQENIKQYCFNSHIQLELLLFTELFLHAYPNYAKSIQTVFLSTNMYSGRFFIIRRELFCEYCSCIFPILFLFEKTIKRKKEYMMQNKNAFILIYEIFFNVWLLEKQKDHSLNILYIDCYKKND